MIGISVKVSRAIVSEMIASLGKPDAAQAIGTNNARFKALAGSKGKLSDSELTQLRMATGKTWRTWLLDAVKHSGAPDQIVSPTAELVKNLNQAESPSEKHSRRPAKSRSTRMA